MILVHIDAIEGDTSYVSAEVSQNRQCLLERRTICFQPTGDNHGLINLASQHPSLRHQQQRTRIENDQIIGILEAPKHLIEDF